MIAKIIMVGVCSALLSVSTNADTADCEQKNYTENYDSLAKHGVAPEWLIDAKLGMYMHWGVYTVPAFKTEWYPRLVYARSKPFWEHHKKNYGENFEYHQFIPFFTGEFFDPTDWAKLMRLSGAKFGGIAAEHHDGFSMWKSKKTPWNVYDMGVKRDVLGEMFKALRRENLRTIATFHHSFNFNKPPEEGANKNNTDGFYSKAPEGTAPKSKDPKLSMLYGNMDREDWLENMWYGKLEEVIDNYEPDIIWFDFGLRWIPDSYKKKFAAHYFNRAIKDNRDVAIVRKFDHLPESFSMLDMERSRLTKANPQPWMTDDSISMNSWCFTSDMEIKTSSAVIHNLIDTVSKNGIMLFNFSPRSDGIIPDDQRKTLLGMGEWLARYGEAIYSTRPWIHFGEGIIKEPENGFENKKVFNRLQYSAKDIRYTRSKDNKTIYAILLGWPDGESVILESFKDSKLNSQDVKRISMLGASQNIKWSFEKNGVLKLSVPSERVDEIANVYKIELN